MKENKKIAIYALLSTILLSSFTAILNVNSVNASQVAMEWGHLSNLVYPPDSTEVAWESQVCSLIDGCFPGSWSHQNAYWTYTTDDYVNQTLLYISNPSNGVTWATTFWVGDFLHPLPYVPPPYGHFAFFGNIDSSNDIHDNSDVYQHATYYGTQASKQYFCFIWTCANGGCYWTNLSGGWQNITGVTWPDRNYPPGTVPPYTPTNNNPVYGYYDTTYSTGVVGMPYAWTSRTDMNLNGYTSTTGSYSYIGFENNSPFLKNTPPGGWSSTGYQYGYFPYYFYRYALGQDNGGEHATIRQSLNYAAYMTFGPAYNFGNSVLNVGQWLYENGWYYCKMRVFGNGNIVLPD